ncbi:hypothetical protein [Kitasatospora purpeofusca]|uniref:hypothetical protein n=1 Tax=Kitasatospora purpeofusca TaxID=67352 RepID=UPI002A5AECA6|nr:hypothetical protein [Kitasatospora purpeofusca]MDY0814833.1 hypothetical protein [Kitasatospora purpeofusca]
MTTASARLLVLGDDHQDPLDRLAYRDVAARAHEALEIAPHYQGEGSMAAREDALHNAIAVAVPAIVAAALLRLFDDPAARLTGEQQEYVTALAVGLDVDTAENLSGANGDGLEDRIST